MHVDEFIDDPETDVYASWFFQMKRLPEILKCKFRGIIGEYKLFCDYDGKKHRVTGASRMGDVWITEDFDRTTGYDSRVDVSDCSNFTNGA